MSHDTVSARTYISFRQLLVVRFAGAATRSDAHRSTQQPRQQRAETALLHGSIDRALPGARNACRGDNCMTAALLTGRGCEGLAGSIGSCGVVRVGCGGQLRALRPLGRSHGDWEVGFGSGGDILPMLGLWMSEERTNGVRR